MKKILIALLALGILASALVAVPLDRADSAHRQVEITVDLDDALALAREAGLSGVQMLSKLQELGVTAVGVREATLLRYRREGTLSLVQGSDLLQAWRVTGSAHPQLQPLFAGGVINGAATYVITENAELAGRIADKARLKLQKPVRELLEGPFFLVEINEEPARVQNLRVGVDPGDVALARRLWLRVVARPDNLYIKSAAAARETMAEFLSLPPDLLSAVVFEGTEVTGHPKYIAETAAALNAAGVPFGIIEFIDRQQGIPRLSALTGYRALLVHPSMPGKTVQAVANSVRERRVRLIYLRFQLNDPAVVEKSLSMVAGVTENLARHGYTGGPAAAPEAPPFPAALRYLVLLGLAAACTLLLAEILRAEPPWLYAVLALSFLAMAVSLPLLSANRALHLWSILAAGAFPSLAVISQQLNRLPKGPLSGAASLRFATLAIARSALLVAAGGLVVVSLTSGRYFIGGTALFHGVKLVHTLPLVLIGLLALLRVYWHQVEKWEAAGLAKVFRDLFCQPVRVYFLALLLVLAAAAFIYVGRTGHTAGLPVPALEVRLRQLLGDILVVRPRFKEFMAGYPLALLGLTLAARGNRGALTTALVAAGAIGPVSMANTFMHFTTPSPVSDALLRSFNGLWLGLLLGLLLCFLFLSVVPFVRKRVKI